MWDAWFAGLAAVCFVCLFVLLWLGRDQWFFGDEWSFLVDRDLSQPGSLFEDHNGHWVTFPAILYRINYQLFGLRTYLPYQVPVVLLHLGTVLLLYLLGRRLGARPWIAALVPSAFIPFGAGSENVVWGFQVTLTASLFCGLAQLLLADHDGPSSGRDVFGIALGAIAIMSSAVGVAIVMGVGAAVLIRRGWAAALLHTAPLAVLYVLWFLGYGHNAARSSTSLEWDVLAFVGHMALGAFEGLARWTVLAVVLVLIAALGAAVAARRASRDGNRQALALVTGLGVAFLSFATVSGTARVAGYGAESGASGRYVHVTAALFLPLVAAGTEALAARRAWLGAAPVLLLAAALPWSIDQLAHRDPWVLGDRNGVVAVAHSDFLAEVPPDLRFATSTFWMHLAPSAGWLRHAVAQGRIPDPQGLSRSERLKGDLAVALRRGSDRVGTGECQPTSGVITRNVVRGDVIRFSHTIKVAAVRDGARSAYLTFHSDSVGTIDVVAGPLTIEMSGQDEAGPRLCGVSREGSGSK